MNNLLAIYKAAIREQIESDEKFRAKHPPLENLWHEVEAAQEALNRVKEKYKALERLYKVDK